IIDRDRLPQGAQPRRGVPQAVHGHVLLARGLEGITRLFPDIRDELLAGGAGDADASEMVWHHFCSWKKRFLTGILCLFQCRPFLEWNIRKRVVAIRNVRLLGEHGFAGVVLNNNGCVNGAEVTDNDGAPTTIPADFVVDCSGRGSRTPGFLESLGWKAPTQSE